MFVFVVDPDPTDQQLSWDRVQYWGTRKLHEAQAQREKLEVIITVLFYY